MPRRRKINPTGIRLLTVAQIAELYHFHPNTIRRWIAEDGLRNYRPRSRGKIFIREDDLIDFLIKTYGI